MAPVTMDKALSSPCVQSFTCSVVLTGSEHIHSAELHVTTHELVFIHSNKDATATCIARVPFCCIFGHEAPSGTVHLSEKQDNQQEGHDQQQQQQHPVSAQDRQIVIHYLQLTNPNIESAAKLRAVRIIFESLQELLAFAKHAIQYGVFPKPRRILLLVNPKGGIGQAKVISDTIVKPMLKHSGHQLTEQYTEYAKHAIDIAKHLNTASFDTVATVSGDGVLHELINGLLSRPDWDQARRQIALALIPAGSGNALATSFGTRDARVAALALIRGRTAKTDVYALAQGHHRPRIYSMLMFTWGILADSDLESDRYRWLGGLRFEIAGFMRIFRLRRYPGKVYIYPVKDKPAQDSTSSQISSSSSPPMKHEHLLQLPRDSASPALPPPSSPWSLLPNMPFYTMFLLLRHPHVNEMFLVSKKIRMNDGIMWVWYSSETRFWRIVKPFITDQSNGKMIHSGLMRHVQAGALLIEPGVEGVVEEPTTHQVTDVDLVSPPPTGARQKTHGLYMKPGYFDVDGEAIYTGRTLIEILPGFLDMVVPEWYDEGRDAYADTSSSSLSPSSSPSCSKPNPPFVSTAAKWKELVLEAARAAEWDSSPSSFKLSSIRVLALVGLALALFGAVSIMIAYKDSFGPSLL